MSRRNLSASTAASSRRTAQISDADAARFLLQAQFTALPEEISQVRKMGYGAWLNDQFLVPMGQTGTGWLTERGHNAVTERGEYFWPTYGDWMIWNQLLTAPDQMRKRLAFALSEFFVVSLNAIDGFWPPYMISGWWDLLVTNTYGNYRQLLERVTLNAAMGMYLNTKGNLKEDANSGRLPDENYAREILQLFSIGLYQLNQDGTLKRGPDGQPIETYVQDDISNLARVFTGYDHNYDNVQMANVAWLNYPVPSPLFCINPMKLDSTKKSWLEVNFLGLRIPQNTLGPDALKMALDHIFNHPNVGPFFGRQMIQRLVKSNPSPAYVARVSAAFADNGRGVRGDLRAVWRAILLDPEARTRPADSDQFSGKLREPVVRFVQWARTVGIHSETGKFEIWDVGSQGEGLTQAPLRSRSVFNYFRPGYVPPQTAMARANVTAPEFQILNESSVAAYVNFMAWTTQSGVNDIKPTYQTMLPIARDVEAIVAFLDLHFAAGALSAETKNIIKTALQHDLPAADAGEQRHKSFLATACLMVLACNDYIVQK